MQGFISNIRASLSYLYGQEITPRENASFVGSVYNIFDALTMCWMSLYFRYISKDWLYSQLICLILIAISTALAFRLPESPLYLIKVGKYTEAK